MDQEGYLGSVLVTAANTSSAGGGTIATDIFLAASGDATNGMYVAYVRFIPVATAPTTTTATVGRVFISTVDSGATTSSNTYLYQEVTLPAIAADNATAANFFYDVVLGSRCHLTRTSWSRTTRRLRPTPTGARSSSGPVLMRPMLPGGPQGGFRVFTTVGGTNAWQPFHVPPKATMLDFWVLGAGAGGGAGLTGAAGTARGGGGSGGTGAVSRLLVAANRIPRVLYLLVPTGGAGGVAGAGGAGPRSFVSAMAGSTVAANLITLSGAADAGGGGVGTGTAGGAAGAAGTIATATAAYGHGLGLWTAVAGQVGIIGGDDSGANGAGPTFGGAGIPVSSGGSGGGTPAANTNFSGGAIAPNGFIGFPSISGGTAGGAVDGAHGVTQMPDGRNGFFSSGGGGGATNGAAGTGGFGGNAGIGSGGGGGGAGVTGGNGGRGGNGLIVITWW